MPITINTNISAMSAQRNLGISSMQSASSLTKLSSGSRVPTAREDAASLSIGTGLRLDVAAFKAAQVNAMQASSLLQIADGSFSQITDILARMKSLATTAQSGQLGTTERGYLNTEFGQLQGEIDRIAATSELSGVKRLGGENNVVLGAAGATVDSDNGFVAFAFDATKVTAADVFEVGYDATNDTITVRNNNTNTAQTLDLSAAPAAGETRVLQFDDIGIDITINSDFDDATTANAPLAADANFQITSASGSSSVQADLDFQVGIGTTANDSINVQIALGSYQELVGAGATLQDVSSETNAATSSGQIDAAVQSVNTARAEIGARMNRLDFAQSNLAVTIENTEAARSTLMDVDVSAEITEFTSKQVLVQAGVSMLAQANQQPSLLLRLLQ